MNKTRNILIACSLVLMLASAIVYPCNYLNSGLLLRYDNNIIEKDTRIMPDTTINNQLFLHRPNSILNTLGDIEKFINKEADLPYLYIINNAKKRVFKNDYFTR